MSEENPESNKKGDIDEDRIYADGGQPKGCLGGFLVILKIVLIAPILFIIILFISCNGGLNF